MCASQAGRVLHPWRGPRVFVTTDRHGRLSTSTSSCCSPPGTGRRLCQAALWRLTWACHTRKRPGTQATCPAPATLLVRDRGFDQGARRGAAALTGAQRRRPWHRFAQPDVRVDRGLIKTPPRPPPARGQAKTSRQLHWRPVSKLMPLVVGARRSRIGRRSVNAASTFFFSPLTGDAP